MTSSTSSLAFAAFLILEEFEQAEPPIKGRDKYKLTFKMDRDTMDQKFQEFQRSRFFNYDSIIQSLKRKLRENANSDNKQR